MKSRSVLAALTLVLVLSFNAGAAEMNKKGMCMMDMPMMKEHMSRMQENMKQMKAAKSDKERMQLMQEHMEMSDKHMNMMMMNMMSGDMDDSKASGLAPPAEPAPSTDEDHKKHH